METAVTRLEESNLDEFVLEALQNLHPIAQKYEETVLNLTT